MLSLRNRYWNKTNGSILPPAALTSLLMFSSFASYETSRHLYMGTYYIFLLLLDNKFLSFAREDFFALLENREFETDLLSGFGEHVASAEYGEGHGD